MNPLFAPILALLLAVAAEGIVEAVFGQPFDFIKSIQPYKKVVLTYIGMAVGVFLANFYKVDLVASLSALSGGPLVVPSIVGFTTTGFIIGRGSNAVHDFIVNVLGSTKVKVTQEVSTPSEVAAISATSTTNVEKQ